MNLKSTAAYFVHVEARFKAGQLSPSSENGQRIFQELLSTIEQLRLMERDLELPARKNDTGREFDEFVQVVDLHMKLTLLLGQFDGFGLGVRSVLVKCGSEREYLF